MALRSSRYRTAVGTGTFVAFILVLVFGSPWYVDWAKQANRGVFLETLAWPSWSFDSSRTVRDIFHDDLRAILVVVFTALFIYLLTGSQLARARGSLSAVLAGWASYMFAGALAALVTAFILAGATIGGAVLAAEAGSSYGLVVGWIVGLATMAGRRP